MNHSVDLLGFPIPEVQELPRNIQLTSRNGLVGHTIRMVFDERYTEDDSVVLLTETGCWAVIKGYTGDDDDSAHISEAAKPLHEVVLPTVLARHGVLLAEELKILQRKQKLSAIADKRRKAASERVAAGQKLQSAELCEKEAAAMEAELAEEEGGAQ